MPWGPPLPIDPFCWLYWGPGEPYISHPGLVHESYLLLPGHPQPALFEYLEEEGEPDLTVF